MKYLLVLVVVVVGLWLLLRARGGDGDDDGGGGDGPARRRRNPGRGPDAIVACAHCGVHVPEAEATHDREGRAFCSDAHRLAGPR